MRSACKRGPGPERGEVPAVLWPRGAGDPSRRTEPGPGHAFLPRAPTLPAPLLGPRVWLAVLYRDACHGVCKQHTLRKQEITGMCFSDVLITILNGIRCDGLVQNTRLKIGFTVGSATCGFPALMNRRGRGWNSRIGGDIDNGATRTFTGAIQPFCARGTISPAARLRRVVRRHLLLAVAGVPLWWGENGF